MIVAANSDLPFKLDNDIDGCKKTIRTARPLNFEKCRDKINKIQGV